MLDVKAEVHRLLDIVSEMMGHYHSHLLEKLMRIYLKNLPPFFDKNLILISFKN